MSAESFEQVAMPHFERLYNFACWLTHDRQEAEDLVQETYVKALKGFSSFRPGTNFRAWIYRILRNAFLTSRTGLKATATVQLDLEGEEENLFAVKETEAVRAIVAWGDAHFELARTACIVSPENVASIRVAEKCGYRELARTTYKGHPVVMLFRDREARR